MWVLWGKDGKRESLSWWEYAKSLKKAFLDVSKQLLRLYQGPISIGQKPVPMSDCFILFIVSLVSVQIEQVLGHSKANMAYFQVYLSQGDTCTCHCATSQIVWNSQTSRQFFELL